VSQYPSPYSPPPQYSYGVNYADLHSGPAKRASVLMWVLSGLTVLGGICCFGFGLMIPKFLESAPEVLRPLQESGKVPPGMFQIIFMIVGGVAIVFAIIFAVLAKFVRSGNMVAMVISLVLTCLLILYFTFNTISAMVTMAGQPSQLMGGLCVTLIPLILFILLLVWLIQAMKAGPQMSAAQSQYAAYYQQYQQQQQAYQQQYGFPPQQQQPTQQPPPPNAPPPAQGPDDVPPPPQT
jgi:hypothetical protein